LPDAIDAADRMRTVYMDGVRHRSFRHDAFGMGVIAMTAVAVYKGVTADTDGTRKYLAKAGAAGGAYYTANTFFNSTDVEVAFLQGYRDVTCRILRARPFLIDADAYRPWKHRVIELEHAITEVDTRLSQLQSLHFQELELNHGKEVHARLGREFHDIVDALRRARLLLKHAIAYQGRVETAGFALRRDVEMIVSDVSQRTHAARRELDPADTLVAKFRATAKAYGSIKPVDQEETGDTTSGAEPKATPNTDGKGAVEDDGKSEEGKAAPKAATPAPSSPATSPGGKAMDDQSAKIKRLEALQKDLQAKVAKLEKDKAPAKPSTAVSMIPPEERLQLRRDLAQLYHRHRKVNEMLIRHDALYQTVKNLEICQPESALLLTLTPDVDSLKVVAGQTYQFSIHGGRGIPRALLVGAKGSGDKEIKLTVVIESGAAIAKVVMPAAPAAGTAYLVVTDSAGIQKEEVALEIEAAPAAEPAKTDDAKKADDAKKSEDEAKKSADVAKKAADAALKAAVEAKKAAAPKKPEDPAKPAEPGKPIDPLKPAPAK
jgi:hypothetical protein